MNFTTTESQIRLELKFNPDGIVDLIGFTGKGQSKVIMTFTDGSFSRIPWAELNGLKTDEEGKIKEVKLL